jgi:hypothetical protein
VSSKTIDSDRTHLATRATSQDGTVNRMLELADVAAGRGDYANALRLLRRLDSMGHQLDLVHEKRRERWRSRLEAQHIGPSQWFG